jgi:hypothetical protein
MGDRDLAPHAPPAFGAPRLRVRGHEAAFRAAAPGELVYESRRLMQ